MKKNLLIFISCLPFIFASCDNEEVDPYQDQEFDFRDDPNENDDVYYPPYYPYNVGVN